jgi:purine-binding chemotaxis protein CheW
MTQYCTFSLAPFLFGVAVDAVQEILPGCSTTPVPLCNEAIEGLINLRGQIVPAVDLRRLFKLPEAAAQSRGQALNVVLRNDDGPLALLVDEIGDVMEMDPSGFELPPPTLQEGARTWIRGTYQLEDRLLLVLDHQRIFQLG